MPTKPVKPFQDWKDGGNSEFEQAWKDEAARVEHRAKAAKAVEATPEVIIDPVTRERREAPSGLLDTVAAITADVAEAKKAVRADEAAATKAMQDDEAAATERARAGAEKINAAKAAREARDEELRLAADAAARAKAAEAPEPEPVERSVVDDLRDAATDGQIGRLGPDISRVALLVNQAAGLGTFAQDGRSASAGVLTLGREVASLTLTQQLPARADDYERLPLSVALSLDDPAGMAWLAMHVNGIRTTAATAALPMVVVVPPEAAPDDLSGLAKLATDESVAVVLLGDETGWRPID